MALFILMVLAASANATPAFAQDDKARAIELISQANSSYDGGDFRTALEKYREAYGITEDPRVLYRIGLTYENLANYQRAREHLELFLLAEPNSKYAGRVKSKVENLRKLEANLQSSVRVESTPAGAQVWIDTEIGKPMGVTPVRIPVGPGGHSVLLKKEGFDPVRATFSVEAGQTVEKAFDLDSGESTDPEAPVAQPPVAEAPVESTEPPTQQPQQPRAPELIGVPTRVSLGPSTGVAALSWISLSVGFAVLTLSTIAAAGGFFLAPDGLATAFIIGGGLTILGGYFLWIHDYTRSLPRVDTAGLPSIPPSPAAGVGFRF